MDTSRSVSSSPTPSEMPRLGFESQSRATTGMPWRARVRAITDDVVVFPDPPLPTTASFIGLPSRNRRSRNSQLAQALYQGFYRSNRRSIRGEIDRGQLAALGLGQLLVPGDR